MSVVVVENIVPRMMTFGTSRPMHGILGGARTVLLKMQMNSSMNTIGRTNEKITVRGPCWKCIRSWWARVSARAMKATVVLRFRVEPALALIWIFWVCVWRKLRRCCLSRFARRRWR